MFDPSKILIEQPGVEVFWKTDTKFTMPFKIGLPITAIEHKDLIKFRECFTIVGQAKIKDAFKKLGSIGYEDTFDEFANQYSDVVKRNVDIFKYEMIDLKLILE